MENQMPEKGTLEYGAWNGLVNSLKLKPGERTVIITDSDTQKIGNAFYKQAALLTTPELVSIFIIEEQGERPLKHLPGELEEAVKQADVTLYMAGCKEGELGFRSPLIKTAVGNGARHGHGPGIDEKIMLSGMQADIPESNRLCHELYGRLNGINWMRITTEAGTDITLEFAPDIKWINSDWDISKPGEWHNLPSAEVFTWPYRVNGVFVVDGVLGDYFDQKYGSLKETPVIYDVKNGHITKISSSNKELEKEINNYVFGSHNGDIIGEVGIGALLVEELVYKMLQDEKVLGTVHIAHGDTYSGRTGAPDYGQTTHADGVILKPTLKTSRGEYILKNGIYQPPRT